MGRISNMAKAGSIEALIDGAMREVAALEWDAASGSSDAGGGVAGAPAARLAMDEFPGYQIVKTIRSGGQATVYLAVEEGTERNVAIKAFRASTTPTARDRYRFEREVEALQELRHPSIVGVLRSDANATRPYLVMEFVPGWNLDEYFREHDLDVKATMRMFKVIAGAVSAAHQKGVIHRDLKASNIRVDHNDEPHVLDFGLAKIAETPGAVGSVAGAAGAGDGEHARSLGSGGGGNAGANVAAARETITEAGQFLGTLGWVSPEQAEGRLGDVDVRTDVYSLGVVLYFMLTGRMPFDVGGSMREVLNRIATTEAARPSVHRREIDDDVDTIVLKCLAKEPVRRYESAGAVAEDVGRWLEGKAILAKRASWWYVAKKEIRRHPGKVGFAAGVASVVVLGGGVWMWTQTEITASAIRDKEFAEDQLQKLKTEIQRQLYGRFGNPAEAKAHVAVFSSTIANYPESARGELHRQLAGLCHIWRMFGEAYEQTILARRCAEVSDGRDSRAMVIASGECAQAAMANGDSAAARRHVEEAIAIGKRLRDGKSDVYASACGNAALILCELGDVERAIHYADECELEERRIHADNQPAFAHSLKANGERFREISLAKRNRGEDGGPQFANAERLIREGVKIGREALADKPADFSHILTALAAILRDQGKLAEAEVHAKEVLAIRRRHYAEPKNHREWLWLHSSMQTLARVYSLQGRFAEGEALLLEAFTGVTTYDPNHPELAWERATYAKDLSDLCLRWDQANPNEGHAEEAEQWRLKAEGQ